MSFKRVIVAVDGGEFALTAARRGLELASQLGAQAALIFVVDLARAMGSPDAGITSQEALIILKKEAEQTLDQIGALYGGPELVKFMPEGDPREDIVRMAESWGADLVVIGTHARTGLSRLLLGSVAEHVVRHSTVPVMVVPTRH